MSDILNEAYNIVQCKECPWYKSCVTPMRFTPEDIRRQMESSRGGLPLPEQSEQSMQNLIAGMASAAQNSMLEGCPIFIDRLRTNPKLAQRIKEIMQNWSDEGEENKKEGEG